MFIKRHDDLEGLIMHWNHNLPSNIGLGNFRRNNNTCLITKCIGRTDLVLINHTDGNQYCFEIYGYYHNTPNEVKEQILEVISNNFNEFLRSLHYLNWLKNQNIKDMSFNDVTKLIMEGLDSFKYLEAIELFGKILERSKG